MFVQDPEHAVATVKPKKKDHLFVEQITGLPQAPKISERGWGGGSLTLWVCKERNI